MFRRAEARIVTGVLIAGLKHILRYAKDDNKKMDDKTSGF
jgi:hypothetical protein